MAQHRAQQEQLVARDGGETHLGGSCGGAKTSSPPPKKLPGSTAALIFQQLSPSYGLLVGKVAGKSSYLGIQVMVVS